LNQALPGNAHGAGGPADEVHVKHLRHDIRLSNAEATLLLELARRLRDEPELASQLNPAEQIVVTNLIDVLSDVAMLPA
jgi:hypothetical protein